MGKRKRPSSSQEDAWTPADLDKSASIAASMGSGSMKERLEPWKSPNQLEEDISQGSLATVQIILGTYDKVVHGMTATVPAATPEDRSVQPHAEFTDTFLLAAHSAAIRCLALSPQKSRKILLASGGSDQVIQVYQLSTNPPPFSEIRRPPFSSSPGTSRAYDTENKSLGALENHGGVINALHFPSRSKLLSAADDSTVAVTRTRDWTVLSSIKAPIPKAHGRPSGDTAPFGGTPAGVNDFAVHPSMKLMVSVGKGEKCMRLWNLVTGKKAGVLNFERNVLQGVGEGKWASGEGRKIRWNSIGEEYVVAFDRGCVVYGIDSKPKSRIQPSPPTKLHQVHYLPLPQNENDSKDLLVLSTEDGRIIFYHTDVPSALGKIDETSEIALLHPIAQFGGAPDGLTGRIKDFEILRLPGASATLIITGGSDGAIRIWRIDDAELAQAITSRNSRTSQVSHGSPHMAGRTPQAQVASQAVGQLIGLYESKHRITCLAAFVMSEPSNAKNGAAATFIEGGDTATVAT